jgi:dihydrolipoamide dehydrogenase
MAPVTRIGIIGGGPGGYEAALVAAQLGAEVTVIDSDGLGGSAVLTDCVPSKTLIATAESMSDIAESGPLGVRIGAGGSPEGQVAVDLALVNARVRHLARAQSDDIAVRLDKEGVAVLHGKGRLEGRSHIVAELADGTAETVAVDAVLVATGAHPRELPDAVPDGERILNWEQVYGLEALPEHLVVVGSGVTGAEFASAFTVLGSQVTLISSRDRVLPGEDADAATVLEDVFRRRGMTVLSRSRAGQVRRTSSGVQVSLVGGGTVEGSHCLMAVGSLPNTAGLGLEDAGVRLDNGGYVEVDRVSRTSTPSVYAAGDCTGVLMLASVAAMQGRIAMWHALGEAVTPLRLKTVAANVFTHPEIATVGIGYEAIASGAVPARTVTLPLATNARAKMQGHQDGFVKLYCRPATGAVIGGVIVAPEASELIFPLTLAVQRGLTVNDLASTIGVYPSLSGSLAEAARRLMLHDDLD